MKKKLFTLLLALVAIAMTAQAQNTNGREYVDLGLPSGTLWATCNVGASKPEEYGNHFAWGETSLKEDYTWDTYQWYDNGYTKYNGSDGKTELDLEDDAANANWGGDWQMPSIDQMKELVNQCTWEWETLNGAYGRRITGPNGNSIFLPAAGWRSATSLNDAGTGGGYWSRMRSTIYSNGAYHMQLGTNEEDWDYYSGRRSDGQVVRPVVVKSTPSQGTPYAVWCKDNNTLYFLSSSTELRVGGTYKGQTISGLWSGETVTNSPQNEDTGYSPVAWMNAQIKFTKVVIEESFKNVLVNSTSAWFMGIESIEGLENLNTSNVTSMSFMFGSSKLTDLDLSHFDTSNVKYMQDMFLRCPNLASLNLSHFDTKNVLNMHWMFEECTSLSNLDLSSFNTENVSDMYGMFGFCPNLTTIYVGDGWSTANVTNGNHMFWGCINLVGGAGTVYDADHRDHTYAHIDGGTANPGYFTDKNAPVTTGLLLNAANFPDANFRKALASILGISEGDEITEAKIAATTTLDVSKSRNTPAEEKNADLTGIEHFTALTRLDCNYNQLTALDVSKNTALTGLYCYNNQLTALDVSKNTALTYLDCNYNQLTALDVSKNTALTYLYCDNNQLTSLDVSQNTALKHLRCYINQLTALDVSKNTALTVLHCSDNQLTALDVSKNTALTELRCYGNQIKGEAMDALVASLPTVTRGYFIVIDTKDENEGNVCTKAQVVVAKEKGWIVIDQYWNNYEGSDDATAKLLLNAENFPDANFRAALASILGISEGEEITDAQIAATTYLNVSSKNIANLTGIEHFTALTSLRCYYNQLTSLDVSKNTALTSLDCYYNQLTSLDVSNNTELTDLSCSSNQLTSLDVSNNTALTGLYCYRNQLTLLDVSKNTVLKELWCNDNQLTSLDVSNNTALTGLDCYYNQLTALNVSNNTALTNLGCFNNQINGEAMDALVASLPTVESGEFYVINTKDENEGNVCTKAQVAIAKEKGWTVYDYNYDGINWFGSVEYEGSDDPVEDIDPVDEDDNIDFGSDMDENDDLNGNVIGDIYYNINTGNGGYNAAEGCIVVKKPTDDGTMSDLEGKDIFGEDFKSQFTGIVFKVPAGKGTIKVNAETTGNMLLKVKIGSGDPVEMELNGKLKVTFPYNVSEPTYVYIYAGAANEAKGLGTTNATEDAALKIYGIEFERGETTEIGASLNDNGEMTNDSWYTLDGVKLSGEPTKKGIYIRNGRKVVK